MLLVFNYIFIAYANACSFVWQTRVSHQDSFVTFLSSGPSLNSVAASSYSVFPKCGRIGPFSNSLQVSSYQGCRHPDCWMVIQAFIELSLQKLFSLQAAALKEIWHHLLVFMNFPHPCWQMLTSHPWNCPRPSWMELGVTWDSGRVLEGGATERPLSPFQLTFLCDSVKVIDQAEAETPWELYVLASELEELATLF